MSTELPISSEPPCNPEPDRPARDAEIERLYNRCMDETLTPEENEDAFNALGEYIFGK